MESPIKETQDFSQGGKLLFSIKEGADALGIGITLMRQLIAGGAVQSVHVGGRHLIPTKNLRDYAASLQGGAQDEAN